MNTPRLSVLVSALAVLPVALVVGAAVPASAAPPSTTFGSDVSWCAQVSTGFSGQHNPSHHRGPAGTDMGDMDC